MAHQAHLKMLRYQLNPHFLFNTLNAISTLILMKDNNTANGMVSRLSDFLRYSLDKDPIKRVPLKQEIQAIDLYLDIEKVRFGKRLVYENHIEEKSLEAKIPNLLLQPIYENAIKHGVYESTEPILIKTEARIQDNELHINISNDFDPEAHVRKGKGIGLKNIQERLILIYNREDLLSVRKKKHSFEVNIKIPQ